MKSKKYQKPRNVKKAELKCGSVVTDRYESNPAQQIGPNSYIPKHFPSKYNISYEFAEFESIVQEKY